MWRSFARSVSPFCNVEKYNRNWKACYVGLRRVSNLYRTHAVVFLSLWRGTLGGQEERQEISRWSPWEATATTWQPSSCTTTVSSLPRPIAPWKSGLLTSMLTPLLSFLQQSVLHDYSLFCKGVRWSARWRGTLERSNRFRQTACVPSVGPQMATPVCGTSLLASLLLSLIMEGMWVLSLLTFLTF